MSTPCTTPHVSGVRLRLLESENKHRSREVVVLLLASVGCFSCGCRLVAGLSAGTCSGTGRWIRDNGGWTVAACHVGALRRCSGGCGLARISWAPEPRESCGLDSWAIFTSSSAIVASCIPAIEVVLVFRSNSLRFCFCVSYRILYSVSYRRVFKY